MSKVTSINVKQRLNRWSFEVHAKGREFAIPVIAFGPEERAQSIAKYVHADYSKLDAFQGVEFEVRPVRHEVISNETYNQINGLEVETKIMGVALQDMAKDFVHTQKPEEVLGDYVTKARNKVASQYGMDQSNLVKQQEQNLSKQAEEEDSDEQLVLGADSVKAMLDGQ